jgi:hypothetical protein
VASVCQVDVHELRSFVGRGKECVDSVHSLGLPIIDVSSVRGLCVPQDLVRFSLLLYKLTISSVKDGGR